MRQFVQNRQAIAVILLIAAVAPIGALANASAAGDRFQRRCGWFSNPTPANASLYDRDGEWIIGEQGGYQVDGDWPEFNARNWVKTNGSYGYGCACFDLQVDVPSHHVLAIKKATARSLQSCRRDSALSKWMKVLR